MGQAETLLAFVRDALGMVKLWWWTRLRTVGDAVAQVESSQIPVQYAEAVVICSDNNSKVTWWEVLAAPHRSSVSSATEAVAVSLITVLGAAVEE